MNTDRNECLKKPCSQECINTIGSYSCRCNVGFLLQMDNKTCLKDICPSDNDCDHLCIKGRDQNFCSCLKGYFETQSGCIGKKKTLSF